MARNNKQVSKPEDSLDEFVSGLSKEETSISEEEKLEVGASSLDESARLAAILRNRDKNADIALKKIYGYSILGILAFWELFVAFIICVQLNPGDLIINKYSDAVLIALLTTATANIVALPAIILKYLFPNK